MHCVLVLPGSVFLFRFSVGLLVIYILVITTKNVILLECYRRIRAEMRTFSDSSDDPNEVGVEYEATMSEDEETGSCNFASSEEEQTFSADSRLCSTDSDFDLSDAEGKKLTLSQELANWATSNALTRKAVNEMLDILRRNGHCLPKDQRTLLKTPTDLSATGKCGGQYIYFGLEAAILKILAQNPDFCVHENVIRLVVNVDGVPLFKSINSQFWPILCSFHNLEVFLVALFYGNGKPDPVNEFLHDFLLELTELNENGITCSNKKFSVEIKCFVCDAPARSLLKGTAGHTGYHSCERCVVVGTYCDHRVVFNSSVVEPERTDVKFSQFEYQGSHQHKQSPLLEYGINCVRQFPLDYMHLVCLGVVKRMLRCLKSGPRICKLSTQQITEISNRLMALNGKLPSEFARQPRSLSELDRWKATELRQFLLYTGPLVLKSVVPNQLYYHFLALSISIGILLNSNDEIRHVYQDYAKELLQYFVNDASRIYGETFTVYNVHGLIHLPEDLHFGSLNEISAFPFENYLQRLKKYVRNGNNPVVQVSKRLVELEKSNVHPCGKKKFTTISTRPRDCVFLMQGNTFAFIKSAYEYGHFDCDVYKLKNMQSLFTEPEDSKQFNIAYITDTTLFSKKRLHKSSFMRKVVCLPFKSGFAVFPMLHEVEKCL